jgi:hypothetical protein
MRQPVKNKTKLPRKIIDLLEDARKAATLENASFDWSDSHAKVECRSGNFDGRPDVFIKERVRLHHSTWIIGPLDRVLKWAKAAPHSPKENADG